MEHTDNEEENKDCIGEPTKTVDNMETTQNTRERTKNTCDKTMTAKETRDNKEQTENTEHKGEHYIFIYLFSKKTQRQHGEKTHTTRENAFF